MKYLTINGFQMAFRMAGAGQPLLLVHGYPLNQRMWAPQFTALSTQAQVITPDLRGHGQSEAVAGPYSMDLLAEDLAALLAALEVQGPVVLCGLSMGGYAALAFARRYPQTLSGLVLAATRAAADSPQARLKRDAAMEQARTQGVTAIASGMAPNLLAPTTLQERPGLLAEVRNLMGETSLAGVLGALAGMKERPDATPTLAGITCPTLVVHGEQDSIVPLDEARQVASAIPGATLEIIPQAGHLLNLEQPEHFNAVLSQFLKRSGGR